MSSPGSTARSARTTVSPPTPESNTPIGLRLYVLSCPNRCSGLRQDVTCGGRNCHGRDGLVYRNALPAMALPRNDGSRPMLLERPHKLQKRCRFIVKLSVKPADPREAALRQRQFAFGDSTLHAAPATSTTCTSFVVDSRPP